jgi:hypothetical protein
MVHNFPLLNSATSAAWCVKAPAAWVSVKYGRTGFTVKNNPRVAGFLKPCPARDSVKFNIIPGVYPGAGPAAIAGKFCAHAFDHLAPSSSRIFLRKGIAKPVKFDNSFNVILGLLSYMRFISSYDKPVIDRFNV